MSTRPAESLFDRSALRAALATTEQPVGLFRDALRVGTAALAHRFEEKDAVESVVCDRARLVDDVLTEAWSHLVPDAGERLALVAVGGYGRGELHPASDVDIMILIDGDADDECTAGVVRFLMFLWDIGIEVGHSVRTVQDCVEQAKADITVATNLIESRLISGSQALYEQMQAATGPDRIWPGASFFEAKLEEQRTRHLKYHDTAYNLEPNFKEGPGGLRDIQMIGWVAKRHFGATTLADLVDHGFLNDDEYQTLLAGQAFLWRIRFKLHTLLGRREDRLLFDHQPTLAREFGYEDNDNDLAVEQFMQTYYRTVIELERLNEMLLQFFYEAILMANHPCETREINRRFQATNGYIDAVDDQVFRRHPLALLEIFLLLQQDPDLKGVRAGTIRLIRANRHLIETKFRDSLGAKSLFMEIMRQPSGITHELRRMNRYGILAAYLPVFGKIVGRMQYDLFHTYTVDEHTLFVVRNLRRFAIREFAHELPVCSALFYELPKPELIYLAGLFHDIAKGRGGDHSELGAEDALHFAEQHGLSEYDARLIAWLVRNHLIMSQTAQSKDISDPEVIHEFALKVGDENRLNYLYLLTVADIRATNPGLWNSWKNSLLIELHDNTGRALRRGLENPIDEPALIMDIQANALGLLDLDDSAADNVRALWHSLPSQYFRRHSPNEIAWHTKSLMDTTTDDLPLVLIRSGTGRGATEVFLYTEDADNLFARNTAVFDQGGLTVVDARVLTTASGQALSTYLLLDLDGQAITDPQRQREIADALRSSIRSPDESPKPVTRRQHRQTRHFQVETRVTVSPSPRGDQSVLELVATDAPGLLAQVASVLSQCDIRVHNAKIQTIGSRAEDVFFVTDRSNRPITDESVIEQIKSGLQNLPGNGSDRT